MAAERFTDHSRALDANGDTLPGAQWLFYATGTLTPRSVYTTSALSVAHANPVVADAGGQFSPIYLDGALEYRGVLKDADGNTIRDIDPINAAAFAQLASTDADKGAALVGFNQNVTGSIDRTAYAKLQEVKTLEDFGAVGYNTYAAATAGTDSTAAIQAAIDWCYNAGASMRAIRVTGNFFQCGNITLYTGVTLLGSGRQCSGFVAKAGTIGKWFTSANAQKIVLKDLVFYGASIGTITHIMDLDTGQLGTEGYIEGCWFRDAPEAYGLYCNGNVAYIRNSTFQTCKFPLKVIGGSNQIETITCMQAGDGAAAPTGAIALDVAGATFIRGLHIEAPSTGSVPIKMTGDSHLSDVMFSLGAGFTHSHLIEINQTDYQDWSIDGLQIIPNPQTATITNGLLYLFDGSPTYAGGTNTVSGSGLRYSSKGISVGGNMVVGSQGAAVADATDAASAITQLNALLARCRAHGLIA